MIYQGTIPIIEVRQGLIPIIAIAKGNDVFDIGAVSESNFLTADGNVFETSDGNTFLAKEE
jgi:hypothetical protein